MLNNKKMKIGQISLAYQPINGGQEVYINELIKVFEKAGFDSIVYQTKRNGRYPNTQMVPRIPFLHRIIPGIDQHIFNLFLYLFFRKKIKSEDIIICHYALQALPVWDLRKKIVVLSHGIEWYPEEKSFNTFIKERIYKRAFDRFVTVANDTDYFRHFGLDVKPGEKFFEEVAHNKWFIPNCVDIEHFKKTEGIPELKNKNIIFVPRQIVPDRGIHLAIESFYHFQKTHKDFYLYIAGQPLIGRYYNFCLSLIKKYALSERVKFLGRITRDRLPDYYSSAKLCLIPTIRREGTSLSALESMSCGTATISTDVAGLKDLPTYKVSQDPVNISAGISAVLENVKEIANQQAEFTRSTFNLTNWRIAWLRVINSIESNAN